METVLAFLRAEARIEIRGQDPVSGSMRYALTDRGRASAVQALARDGYLGPAPVPLAAYAEIVDAQSIRQCRVTHQAMRQAFSDTIISERLLDQLGPALHSGRAMFLYGQPGTGAGPK